MIRGRPQLPIRNVSGSAGHPTGWLPALVSVVTAVLNLDSSVAFLAPVLIYTAPTRGVGEAPLVYGCLLRSNAASLLLLPGSNLTNLIVVRHLHLSGGRFAARMAPAWVAAIVVTAAVETVAERRSLQTLDVRNEFDRPVFGLGPATLGIAVVLMVVLGLPGPAVAGSMAAALAMLTLTGHGVEPLSPRRISDRALAVKRESLGPRRIFGLPDRRSSDFRAR